MVGGAILAPTIVRAIPSPLPECPREQQLTTVVTTKPKIEAISEPSAIWYECIVGDFRPNLNGHVYPKAVWEQILKNDVPFSKYKKLVVMDGGDISSIRLESIVGYITQYEFRASGVWVRMYVMDTPQGKAFQTMQKKAPMFLTPVGNGTLHNGVIGNNYAFSRFNIGNNSAFECATPLRASDDTTNPIVVPLPGGESLKYPTHVLIANGRPANGLF